MTAKLQSILSAYEDTHKEGERLLGHKLVTSTSNNITTLNGKIRACQAAPAHVIVKRDAYTKHKVSGSAFMSG
jgi:hypothetical protein